jgi:hypothetical protein
VCRRQRRRHSPHRKSDAGDGTASATASDTGRHDHGRTGQYCLARERTRSA